MTLITHSLTRKSLRGFTLAEIAITLGIVAGTALLILGIFSTVAQNVKRLKEVEAPLRPGLTINPTISHPNHPLPDEGGPFTKHSKRPPQ